MIPSLYPHLAWSDLAAYLSVGRDASAAFERNLNEKFKAKHSLTFYSGRAGLYNILKANNIHGKRVLVTAYTCCVVTEAIAQSGNTPVFIDTAENSFNADITDDLLNKYGKEIAAVVVTNLYGITDFAGLESVRKSKEILFILDNALSPGHIPSRPPDLYDYVTISCGVRKPFSCLGGGVVFVDDDERFRALRDYVSKTRKPTAVFDKLTRYLFYGIFFLAFRPAIYSITSFVRRRTPLLRPFFDERGHDVKKDCPEYYEGMAAFQKRIGVNQLKKIDKLLARRKEIGDSYYRLLSPHFSWVSKYWREGTPYSHVPFLHPERDALERHLLRSGIDVERYFDYAVPELPQYHENGMYPNASSIARQVLNLPINAGLSEKAIAGIVDAVLAFDRRQR